MRRTAPLAIAAFVFCCLHSPAALAQTVDEVLARALEARGGEAAIRAVHSFRQTGTLRLQGGDVQVTIYAARPGRIRQELLVAGQQVVVGFDGTTAWTTDALRGTGAPVRLPEEEAKALAREAAFEGPLAAARADGRTIALVGTETRGGRSVYHLQISSRDAHFVEHCYVDAATGLEVALVTESEAGTVEQELLDYRTVNGLRVPFRIRTTRDGRREAEIEVAEVAVNVAIDPALFAMPAAPAP